MMLLLKIAALVVIVLVLLGFAAVSFFLRWIRKVFKDASDGASCPPCRVNPEPEANPQWRSAAKVAQFASEFKALGFEEIGAFSIPEMQGLQMLAFVFPAEQIYGTIYDHKKIPPSIDIFCDFEDETGLTASSSKLGSSLDKRPGHPILWVGDDRVAAVLEAFRQHPQPSRRVPVSREGFLPHFKRSYAESMNWRLKKGGVSRDEIRRHTESRGQPVTEEVIEEVYKKQRKAHVAELKRACLAQYLDEQQISPADWERIQGRAVVIPESLETDELVETLEAALVCTLDQEQRHALRQLRKHNAQTALDIVDEILIGNVAALNLEKYGEVQEPVRAYVLLTPAREEAAAAVSACA